MSESLEEGMFIENFQKSIFRYRTNKEMLDKFLSNSLK